MRRATIYGNITADPKPGQTTGGVEYTTFSIACKDEYNKERTHFFNCIAWQKKAEAILRFFKKGDPILFTATIAQERWTQEDGTNRSNIVLQVDEFEFTYGSKRDANN